MVPMARWQQHVDGDDYGPRKQAKAQSVSARVEGEVGQPSTTILMHSSTVSKMLSGFSITCLTRTFQAVIARFSNCVS